MSGKRYSDEFRREALRQVTERGYSVAEVAERLGISAKSLYAWRQRERDRNGPESGSADNEYRRENARLKADLRRVSEERDILKKAAAYFARESE